MEKPERKDFVNIYNLQKLRKKLPHYLNLNGLDLEGILDFVTSFRIRFEKYEIGGDNRDYIVRFSTDNIN